MGGRTLSRLASELRIRGLLGPANLLLWRGSPTDGRHHPEPTSVFERLSNAGDGWYFFLCSQISFHTFIIAVRVSGGSKTFFEIQGGQSVEKTPAEVNDWFNKQNLPNEQKASSRIWPVYVRPDH